MTICYIQELLKISFSWLKVVIIQWRNFQNTHPYFRYHYVGVTHTPSSLLHIYNAGITFFGEKVLRIYKNVCFNIEVAEQNYFNQNQQQYFHILHS